MRHLIESFWKEIHLAAGYELVNSPHVAKTELWRVSGHYDFYKENMFDQMEVRPGAAPWVYACRPEWVVNCASGHKTSDGACQRT